jgi:predicted HD phosphohydrolase
MRCSARHWRQPHHVESAIDDVHQFLAIPFLRGTFCDAVLEPIRLHVDAKRYLCRAEASYGQRLSAASRHSLELQGGRFGEIQAERFLARPFSWDAIRLRRWDDQAKVPGKITPPLDHFATILRLLAKDNRPVAA